MTEEIVHIIPPSEEVDRIYQIYKTEIESALPTARIRLIGSFAVPMKGKEELDILIETDDIVRAQKILEKFGYNRGPIIDREGYMHKRSHQIMCEAHIVLFNDKKIRNYLAQIEKLRKNSSLREDYERLKETFDGKPKSEYKKAKNNFLEKRVL